MKQKEEKIEDTKIEKWIWVVGVVIAIPLLISILAGIFLGINKWQVDFSGKEDACITLEYGKAVDIDDVTAVFKDSWFFKKGFPLEVSREGSVDFEKTGEYELTYRADVLWWKGSFIRKYVIIDATAPEITLTEIEGAYTLPGTPYKEEGYSAFDEYDGDLTEQVQVQEKDGKVYYKVSDSSGNEVIVERDIFYDDPFAPEITLLGDASITITAGSQYIEPGWTVTDNLEELQNSVVVESDVNIYRSGTYHVQYSVSDSWGNQATASREVIVQAIPQAPTQAVEGKVIYLTFDDGPGPYTEKLLEILEKYNVKATFFVTNNGYNHLIAKEAEAGHTVAIHAYNHEYKEIYASEEAYFEDLNKMQEIIYQLTGNRTNLVRFPGGSSNRVSRFNPGIMTRLSEALSSMGFKYFDWNVTSGDAGGVYTADEVFQNVVNGIKDKRVAIVLQHDIMGFSVDAVERIIIWGIQNGYTFLPLTESSPVIHHTIKN